MVTMIQVVVVSIIGLVIPRLYARDWSNVTVDTDKEEEEEVVVEKCLLGEAGEENEERVRQRS